MVFLSPVPCHLSHPEDPDQHGPGEADSWDQSDCAHAEYVLLAAEVLCVCESGSSHGNDFLIFSTDLRSIRCGYV